MAGEDYLVIDVVDTLDQIHNAFASGEPARMAAAESVLSALILNLREREAILPVAVQTYLDRL